MWPSGDWRILLLLAGRGWGKTRTGAQMTLDAVRKGYKYITLIGRTVTDVRDVMITGESGILASATPQWMPKYYPSKRPLIWPNGALARSYSADNPDQLRGPQSDFIWMEELAAWAKPNREDPLEMPMAYSNAMFGMRLGTNPKCVITTTPKPTKLIKNLAKRGRENPKSVKVVGGSTYENFQNLAPAFIEEVITPFEGTRIGRQELEAELLEDVEGALWTMMMIESNRVMAEAVPEMQRIVIAIDPSGGHGANNDEQGIVADGLGVDGHYYLLADLSCKMRPEGWAGRAVVGYHDLSADRIVYEDNFGGEMVEATIKAIDENVPVKSVHASKGKSLRAEPISALYEKGLVHHVGFFPKLEEEQTMWTPGAKSPNRLDAHVFAITELMNGNNGGRSRIIGEF